MDLLKILTELLGYIFKSLLVEKPSTGISHALLKPLVRLLQIMHGLHSRV